MVLKSNAYFWYLFKKKYFHFSDLEKAGIDLNCPDKFQKQIFPPFQKYKHTMAVDIAGVVSIVVFYIIVLVVGIVAGKKNKKGNTEELLVAGRHLGLFVASLTSAATMVGGAYINGTAEVIARDGLVWTIGPIGYNISIFLAAFIYVPKVRKANYTTIIDPLQEKYGNIAGSLLFIPELIGDLFWEAAILAALGSTLSIILGLDMSISIIVSACIAVSYTFFGGLYSVAYTDIVQLSFIVFGLIIVIPFAWSSPAVDISTIQDTWKGELDSRKTGLYIDTWLLTLCGTLTWQAFYQRILACKSVDLARNAAIFGGIISLLLAIPPAMIGIIGSATDWNQTTYLRNSNLTYEDWGYISPMVMEYLCPKAISVLGLGAISAAVMSSADSIVLAAGSVVTINIYKNCFRQKKASDTELKWVLRVSILGTGALGTIIAIAANSVYGLYILCADAMYVVQVPALTCALWVPFANAYGAVSGFIIGSMLRILGGEPVLSFKPVIEYPGYHNELGQLFPFKTFAMLSCTFSIIVVSYITNIMFSKKIIPIKYDLLKCFVKEECELELKSKSSVLHEEKNKT